MSLLISGTVAIDHIKTPTHTQENLLGGSAAYAALAASLFCKPVHLSGVIGQDYPEVHLAMLADKGISLDSLQRNAGESFTWSGEYHEDMNSRTTHKVAVNVLESWAPRIAPDAAKAQFAVLGNMSPENQIQVLDQCKSVKFVAADTMDIWIQLYNERLHDLMKRLDLLVINEGEAKAFAETTNLVEAGRRLQKKGPRFVVVKRGEHGSFLFGDSANDFFACAAYPLSSVFDPTGAGDSFLGGMIGWLAAGGKTGPSFSELKTAVAHGSVIASFTCEAFSTQRLESVTRDEVNQRLRQLKGYADFAL